MKFLTRIAICFSILFYLVISNGIIMHNHLEENSEQHEEHHHQHTEHQCSICFYQHLAYDSFNTLSSSIANPFEIVFGIIHFQLTVDYQSDIFPYLPNKSPPINNIESIC